MTERERWTVYPLLFLSLGIGLRSHFTSSLDLHDISCHTLKSHKVEIFGDDDDVQLELGALPTTAGGGGIVRILSAAGKPELILRASPHGGHVEVISAKGVSQIVLEVQPAGGVVKVHDPAGKMFRALAPGVNPAVQFWIGPPPTPPAAGAETEEPAGEPAEKPADEPSDEPAEPKGEMPATEEPAGETPDPNNDQPSSEQPGEEPTER